MYFYRFASEPEVEYLVEHDQETAYQNGVGYEEDPQFYD